MATEENKLTKNVHSEALDADASDKKKGGKFQPFKKLFGKRKKKDTSLSREESLRKKSQSPRSISNGTFSSDEEALEDNLRSFNYSMGTRAFSHDSIFIPDGGAESEQTVQAMSQDNILGKVKTLQRHLGKNIKFGQRPSNAIPMKKAGSGEASSEEDLFLTSPMEIVTQQDIILSDTENKSGDTPSPASPLNLPGAGSEMEEKVAPVKPSRPKRHFSSAGTIESVNLDAIPLAIARLDNSAAKHKLSVKPKKQRVSKKHRRLAQDGHSEPGGLDSQPSLGQNGHPGEDTPAWREEEPERLDSEEERRHQEDYWRELEAKCKRQKAEAAEKRRLEEQRLQALERKLWEENRRQGLLEEKGELEEEEEEGDEEEQLQLEVEREPWEGLHRGLEEQACPEQESRAQEHRERLEAEERRRLQEEAEERRRLQEEAEERRRLQEEAEERRRLQEEAEEQRRLQEEAERLEEQRQREAERQRQEEQERELKELRRLEEQQRQEAERQRLEEEARRLEELEARRRREQEEERRLEELRRQQEEAKQREELERQAETEAQGRLEAQQELGEAPQRPEEERRPPPEDSRSLQSELQDDFEEKPEGQESSEPKRHREGSAEEQSQEPEPAREQPGKRGDLREDERPVLEQRRDAARTQIDPPRQPEAQVEETLPPAAAKEEAAPPEKDRKVEELRWQEVDERQTMPRPYTFQVSSGGKQILFPKVNLSPVTPAKDAGPSPAAAQEPKAPRALPSALSIPHTAILVTGAQLCGPAVNLSQIKDTACKSLLGLSEEKRLVDAPAAGGKARPPPGSPSSAAALAEWASIRSRILRTAEGEPEPAPRARGDPRAAPRKPPPANAKFSIMPAWQKFSDGGAETPKPNAEAEGARKRPAQGPREEPPAPRPDARPEPAHATDGCKFAKDLPSFLVPGLPSPPQRAAGHADPAPAAAGPPKPDPAAAPGEDKASPFGIKLRRTNYSLRFHCDQQAEQKKKKRHSSTGDGGESASPPAGSAKADGETEGEAPKRGPALPAERKPGRAAPRDSAESPASHSPPAAQPGPPPAGSQAPAPLPDRAPGKAPLAQKPALAPKPAGQTPPASPLSKLSRPYLVELLARRAGRPEPEPSERPREGQESSDAQPPSPPPPGEKKLSKRDEEEEVPAGKPASPPTPAPQQERPSQTPPEAGRKEKPVLQSRHSLDGSKLMEKVETAQPLWITLALQKQKGFREQQATREERKQAREAKQAEKLYKENVSVSPQPGSGSISRAGSVHRSSAQPEEEKPETAVSRLERREQLKKANTLPTSVTVEISDSAPTTPLVKEVTKRFSTPDAAPVSTEPAWLALAKRKAKAWSDCPQIIK